MSGNAGKFWHRSGGWRVAGVGLVVSGKLGLQADDASFWWLPVVVGDDGNVVARCNVGPVLLEDVVPKRVVRRHVALAGWR
jgi:hypothetical protein